MRRLLPVCLLLLAAAGPARARGLLIPADKDVPPLAMLSHQVQVQIEEQVAVTQVTQVFRNHTDRPLEATYVFPVPKGAGVKKFTMWVDGKEVAGELVEADKARTVYTEIVRRTQDPGLLEYVGNNLLRLRVFPVPARGDQKLMVSYTSVAERDAGLVEYVYPLKADGKAASTLEKFSVNAVIKSRHPVQSVYSPTHAITVHRPSDREARVAFERDQASLDKDFQLFYALADKDVGLTTLTYRPSPGSDGCFLMLISPRAELAKKQQVPRDVVFVVDTSGSMAGPKIEQARRAVKFCLDNLSAKDRFAVLNFATAVNRHADGLVKADGEHVAQAKKWVDRLEATGGTAIDPALAAALELRSADMSRSFTVVFFTDGQPTVGETSPDKILQKVLAQNTANTRIFTFGVGDDVNAALLDRLADQSRAVSTYVRPAEDIEAKVSSLYSKVSHPVLTNLKLTAGKNITLSEVYPTQLPDLFHGSQLVVLGRYHGQGHAAVTLTGSVGEETREFVYEVEFPGHTGEEKAFVEDLWARRKVGYLLDQVRGNGEKKELVDEVVALAKKHGITTPYTSYLVVPDAAVAGARPVSIEAPPSLKTGGFVDADGSGTSRSRTRSTPVPPVGAPAMLPAPATVADFARQAQGASENLGTVRDGYLRTQSPPGLNTKDAAGGYREDPTREKKLAYEQARAALAQGQQGGVQVGKLGVDFAVQLAELRNQSRVAAKAVRQAAGRTCMEIGGVWIDEGFDAKMTVVAVKAQSAAYFRILEKHPEMKEVFQLGNHLVWVTPSKAALVIDTQDGKEQLDDAAIDKLFAIP